MQFVETLRNAWKIKDLRKKMIFTLAMLFVFRLGSFVPVPGIDPAGIAGQVEGGGLLGLFDIFSGGALSNFSIFAMGIMPYINASIITQLLTVVIPKFEAWSKEGEEGRKKLTQVTRFGTVILGTIQATGLSFAFRGYMSSSDLGSLALVVISLTAGTAFLMWLGEQITENGIGNGISLIIFAGIVSRLPLTIIQYIELIRVGEGHIFTALILVAIALVVLVGVIYVQEGERKIPVQYAKRVVGRKMYGGQSTHIPLKVNQAGVIPVIFATSLLLFPATIGEFWDNAVVNVIARFFDMSTVSGQILQALLIVFFAYFYTAITVNPVELADNMKKNGGFIPGIRPGKPTSSHIERILTRITLVGALFLALIVVIPFAVGNLAGVNIGIGGTSLLIVVGVALETMKQIESQLIMRHYKGFMG
ncbi:preprotein translocase subunit SecY [Alkalicella caledoniensis]|uniref:Protein translocase subunit SecY n=1 Tax=Alkalicella caledoniensis TaxID=2731377 RepID=A0A7G9W7V9_ALKCA|nr:preprotein translocase subunit SecY [Alkalicella caledoniensis]QNO14771.1 preprotein translocase subunit SecY [Alkalicella caledoniensis]